APGIHGHLVRMHGEGERGARTGLRHRAQHLAELRQLEAIAAELARHAGRIEAACLQFGVILCDEFVAFVQARCTLGESRGKGCEGRAPVCSCVHATLLCSVGRGTAASVLNSNHEGKSRTSCRSPLSFTVPSRIAWRMGVSPSQMRENAPRSASTNTSTSKPGSMMQRSTSGRWQTNQ